MRLQLNEDQDYNYLADDLGYRHGICPQCRKTVWTDSGAFECSRCGANSAEDDQTDLDRSQMRRRAIRQHLEGLDWIYRLTERVGQSYCRQRIDDAALQAAYRVLIPLQANFKGAILLEAAK